MKEKHIRFENLEPDEVLDQSHLDTCEDCRRQWQLLRFIRLSLAAAPEIEPSPFFASRVKNASRSISRPLPFFVHLTRMARRLTPVLMMLVIFATSVLYWSTRSEGAVSYWEVLLEQPSLTEEISLEFIVHSLHEHSEEADFD